MPADPFYCLCVSSHYRSCLTLIVATLMQILVVVADITKIVADHHSEGHYYHTDIDCSCCHTVFVTPAFASIYCHPAVFIIVLHM